MSKMGKRADLYQVGDEFEPLEYKVTEEWNAQFKEALEAYYSRYEEDTEFGSAIVVPGLFIGNSNITRSPGFKLDPGMACVHTKEEVEYINPGRVGKKFKVTWKVIEYYEKRGRPWQVKDALIIDEDGVKILRRRILDTYMGGPYKGGKESESNSQTPQGRRKDIKFDSNTTLITKDSLEGQEFLGKLRTVSLDRINFFSGGFPKGENWPAKNIHTDLTFANKCGLKTRAASGAMFEGYLTDFMIDLFGIDWLNYGKMNLAFINIVDKDDTLIPRGVIKKKEPWGSGVELTLDLWCENQYGTNVVVGTGKGFVK